MHIRPATPEDSEVVARIQVETWRSTYSGIISARHLSQLSIQKSADYWKSSLLKSEAGRFLLVIESEGAPRGFLAGGPNRAKLEGFHGIEQMRTLNDSNRQGFLGLLQEDVEKEMDYKFMDGTPGRSSIEDMILHAFSHGFHHVGQMAAIASKAGAKFPNVSYIGFTRAKSMAGPK